MLNVSRSGVNLVANSRGSSKVQNLQRSFLPERVIPVWNKLPSNVKNSDSITSFKVRLEEFKKANISSNINSVSGNFWEVSYEVLSRIEGPSYLANKEKHNKYLSSNPHVAKKRFINMYTTGIYS